MNVFPIILRFNVAVSEHLRTLCERGRIAEDLILNKSAKWHCSPLRLKKHSKPLYMNDF